MTHVDLRKMSMFSVDMFALSMSMSMSIYEKSKCRNLNLKNDPCHVDNIINLKVPYRF